MSTVKPAQVIGEGRLVMRAHPDLHTAAAEILHHLDTLTDEDRIRARRYLLHVYGMTVGITTPSSAPLETVETWAADRNALAAAAGFLEGLVPAVGMPSLSAELEVLALNHAAALMVVAHRG